MFGGKVTYPNYLHHPQSDQAMPLTVQFNPNDYDPRNIRPWNSGGVNLNPFSGEISYPSTLNNNRPFGDSSCSLSSGTQRNVPSFTPMPRNSGVQCLDCGQYGHHYNDCPNKCSICSSTDHTAQNHPCPNCRGVGHLSAQCPNRCGNPGNAGNAGNRCTRCHMPGHTFQVCNSYLCNNHQVWEDENSLCARQYYQQRQYP